MKLTEEQLKTKVFEAIGQASMCWSETPKGVFDSTKAEAVGNELWAAIEQILTPAAPPRSAEERPIVVFGEPERFKSIDERILDEIHNSEEPTIRSAEEILNEAKLKCSYNWGKGWIESVQKYESELCVPNEVAIKAMHAYASQFRKEVTDEEIDMSPLTKLISPKITWMLQYWSDGWLLHLYKRDENNAISFKAERPPEHFTTLGAASISGLITKATEWTAQNGCAKK